MNRLIGNEWDEILKEEIQKPYFKKIEDFVSIDRKKYTVYPSEQNVFAALKYVDYSKVKVVIVGQDPYINPNQANGLAFAVSDKVEAPPSLKNIFKEIESDIGVDMSSKSHQLIGWAKQGVMLLNATLTVRAGESNSHQNCGWQVFTDKIIGLLGARKEPMVFILWGAFAAKKETLIENQHYIIKSAHPSPLSASKGFFGSKPFSKANKFLLSLGQTPIDWSDTGPNALPYYYEKSDYITRV